MVSGTDEQTRTGSKGSRSSEQSPGSGSGSGSGSGDDVNASAAEKPQNQIHCIAYLLYYTVLFFAFWFGSARFDVDGDGDFDPEDVEAYLNDHTFLHKNYKKARELHPHERDHHNERLAAARQRKSDAKSSSQGGPGRVFGESEVEGGVAEEDIILENLLEKQVRPWFCIGQAAICSILLVGSAIVQTVNEDGDFLTKIGGLDSFFPGRSTLAVASPECDDYRRQVWRWFTYQFTHSGFSHVGMNCINVIVLGIPLEGIHGFYRLAVLFNAGVIGATCLWFLLDSHGSSIGCSGGCYALMGIHLADLVMNWSEKKFRWPTLMFLSLLIIVDVVCAYATTFDADTSHIIHLGGGSVGFFLGIILVKNLRQTQAEKVIYWAAWVPTLGYVVVSLWWLYSQTGGPRNLFEAYRDIPGWCWYRQFWDPRIDKSRYLCVRCGTKACIEDWSAKYAMQEVLLDSCLQAGWYEDAR